MSEAAHVDEAQVEGEEDGAGDQPQHDQLEIRTRDRDGEEDHLRDRRRDGRERLVDGLVDSQRSPARTTPGAHASGSSEAAIKIPTKSLAAPETCKTR